MRNREWLMEITCYVLMLYFFYEGIQKLAYMGVYASWLLHAPLIKSFGTQLKYIVPAGELLLAALMLVPAYRTMALYGIIAAELLFIFWVMSVYLFTGFLFWPYHALWSEPTWMQKMGLALVLAWLSFMAIGLSGANGPANTLKRQKSLRNKPADVN